jgi:hypothetical protein
MIAESSAGNANVKSARRMTTSSTQPRCTAARRPSATPNAMPMPTAIRPTAIETRLPTMMSVAMSRPRLSVPSQCDALGGCSLCGMSSSVGGCGVQTYESSARPTTSATSTCADAQVGVPPRLPARVAAHVVRTRARSRGSTTT